MVQLWWYPSGPAGPKKEEISKISTTTAPDTVGWPPRVSAGLLRRRRVDCRACPTEEIRRGECVEQRTKVAVFSSVGCAILNLKKKNLLDPHSGYDIVTSPPEEKLECCGGNQQFNTRPIGKKESFPCFCWKRLREFRIIPAVNTFVAIYLGSALCGLKTPAQAPPPPSG